MKTKLKEELKRKSIHMLSLVYVLIFVFFLQFGKNWALFSLIVLLIVFLILDFVRVELKKNIPVIGHFWRKKEKYRFGGHVFFLTGVIICFAAFDFKIAVAATLMTVFGDMTAALIGIRFGKIWISKDRALEGILAEFAVNLIIGFLIIENWIVIIAMALTATLVETSTRKLDDNFMVPVTAGFSGEVFKILTGL